MKGYDNYKESNFEWFDKIPIKWNIASLNHLVTFIMGQAPHSDSYNTDGIGEIFVKTGDFGILRPTAKWYTSTPLVFASESDVFMCVVGATSGKVNLGINGTISRSIAALRPNKNINQKFLYYFLSCNYQILNDSAQGSAQGIINKTILSNIKMPIPTIEEQSQIVSFLDYKTNLIDATIEKKKRLIELLKEKRQAVINEAVTKGLNANAPMKDSGVEWLGEIPQNWEVVRLKQIAKAFGRIGYRGYTTEDIVGEDEGAITISPSNMKGNYMTFENCTFISWDKYEESPEIKIYNDDILMVKTGSTYGKVGIVKNLEKKATINPQLLVLKDVKINPDYLFNLLRTNYIEYQVETNVIGSTIPTISQTKILNFSLPLPPNEEIELIMIFIQNQMNLIDKTQKSIEIAIQKLQTYRQSLISEAVTGKIDVRDWQTK